MAGGVVAAFLGPQLGQWGRDWIAGDPFTGAYLAQAALAVLALAMISQLRLPPVAAVHGDDARPLRAIVRTRWWNWVSMAARSAKMSA